MASSNSSCSMCEKGKGIVRCEGCTKIFCFDHLVIHRQELAKNFDGIQTSYNITYESVAQQLIEPSKHTLIEKIDRWEQDAIAKIKVEAEMARKVVLGKLTGNLTALKTQLQALNQELQESRQSNCYLETDLTVWQEKLKILKEESTNPSTIGICDDSATLISKLRVDINESFETFDRSFGGTTFEDHGKVVLKQASSGHTEIRGKQEYQTGHRTLKFKIEQLQPNGWIMFGIISRGTALQQNSYGSPTNYAWATRKQIYQAGSCSSGTSSDAAQNDIIHLGIDCDQRTIRFFNERSNHTLQIQVDVNRCPFPWQLHLNLFESSTKVRILE